MDQEDRIYISKVISIQNYNGNHSNIIHSNHGNGTQPHKQFKVFEKHRVNNQILTLLSIYGVGLVKQYNYILMKVWCICIESMIHVKDSNQQPHRGGHSKSTQFSN